ncbi:hypothetical protein BJY04DRAFT_142386 [Aspergillus karnatakaensis]|uniref:uncharacterized protein n=1 Tax=Aspergillus karnatakaensis TaxID=1810916 RepID=UPI003CCE2A0A
MEFPELGEADLDRMIESCWKGAFTSVCELLEWAKRLDGSMQLPRATGLTREDCERIRQECLLLVQDGLLA